MRDFKGVTIAVTIRSSSAVVFAADSKLTTSGVGGYKDDGEPIWLSQSYDNAYKVARDRNGVVMAMVVGHANAGQIAATDLIAGYAFPDNVSSQEQEAQIEGLSEAIAGEISSYWGATKIEPKDWPTPTIILAAASADKRTPRLWKGRFEHPKYKFEEFLKTPGIDTDGTFTEVDSLLYRGGQSSLRNKLESVGRH